MRRSILFLGALCAAGLTAAFGQNVIPGNHAARPEPAAAPIPSVVGVRSSGKAISADNKLSPRDLVSVQIVEDEEPALKTVVSDAGEVEINLLGSVKVSGETASEAAATIRAYLLKDYYNKATVDVRIIEKSPESGPPPDKATIAGKVGRAGPQYFNAANPLKLSEAVITAGITTYTDLKHVQLTRGGQKTIINLEDIIKNGRTDLDVELRNGDQIYVKPATFTFSGN